MQGPWLIFATAYQSIYIFLLSCPHIVAYPAQDPSIIVTGFSQGPGNTTASLNTHLSTPPASLQLELKYVHDGVYFSEVDFYSAMINAIAEEAVQDYHMVTFRTRWLSYPSIGLQLKSMRDTSGISVLNEELVLYIFEKLIIMMSSQGNQLAEAFFYPKWNGNLLGVGRVYSKSAPSPQRVGTLSAETPPPTSENNFSLSTSSPFFDLDVRITYNLRYRNFPPREVFWAIIQGILAVAPHQADEPCRSIRRASPEFEIAMVPRRNNRGLFTNKIVVNIYKAIAEAMCKERGRGWFGEIKFGVFRNDVPIADGHIKSTNRASAVQSTDMTTS